MKKIGRLGALLIVTLILGGCGTVKESKSPETLDVVLILVEEGEEFARKELSFEAGAFLQDVMEAHLDILVEDGMIASIEGRQSDANQQKYWLYQVNGIEAEVGAKDYQLKDQDEVVWELAVLDF